jgi:2-polyprenyl-6-methoxyphenol hydroxylase-like FAD-dependent oxidoreductase
MSLVAKPKVLIVGAGIGGMALGILLHKAKIPFEIYERATVVKPLGIYLPLYMSEIGLNCILDVCMY